MCLVCHDVVCTSSNSMARLDLSRETKIQVPLRREDHKRPLDSGAYLYLEK